ncbi:Small subunit of serine palmitoyltransferase [Collichthys lucidus]|uniref:Small subunit of serine palmitoyltransferase n=1 Tax=Collichthys lucidus TaxID=240159 RepID=A0A4U5VDF6_COLLU|nr:Small subunit of serine palmitoyltransferase [Collichthys lucidus]
MALGDCWKQLSWFYYQYLLVTALYMLEPWERTVFSILSRVKVTLSGFADAVWRKRRRLVVNEPVQRAGSDSLLISVAGMAVYTGYVFMPQHIMAILHYFEVVQ